MPRRSDSRAARAAIPDFAPVPVRARSGGWSPSCQAAFLEALAQAGTVAEAARRVGKSRESAYRLRTRPGARSFTAAWDAILAELRRHRAPG